VTRFPGGPREAVREGALRRIRGSLVDVSPGVVRCIGADAAIGEEVRIEGLPGGEVPAEVVALRGGGAVLLPLAPVVGARAGLPVRCTGRRPGVPVGEALLGRILDGTGVPMDGRPVPRTVARVDVDAPAPRPLERPRLRRPLATGVRAIDAFATLAEGQRIGLFAGPGAGKSSLLARLARGAGAEVCVLGLVGERGREVREMVDDALGPEGMRRAVVVAATSDAPAVVRMRAAQVATAVACWFAREGGRSVLLLVDSLTRFARAVREVGLAAGEAPVRQGYPARTFSEIPRLVERAGTGAGAPITAIYTVLSSGDAAEDPMSAEIQGLLDGHLVLDRRIAEGGRHPAIDVLASLSRAMPAVTSPEHRAAAVVVRRSMARFEAGRELLAAGAWVRGADPELDAAAAAAPGVEAFLRQEEGCAAPLQETVAGLVELARAVSS
jgi:ATP synthase in type III secretion protein N